MSASLITGAAGPAMAASEEPPAGAAPQPALADASRDRARLILVGKAAESAELENVLRELLAAHDIQTRLLRDSEFEPDRFLSDGTEPGVSVFIVPRGERAVRLYLRGPDGQRFLIRDLELPRGLDELGRELVAQVVESSVLTLLQTGTGMDREQARARLETEARPHETRAEPPPRLRESQSAPPPRSSSQLTFWIAAGYGLHYLGSDVGALHGPRLELGVAIQSGGVLRARITGDRYFSRTVRAPEIAGDLQSNVVRVWLDGGPSFGRHRIVLSLGGGAEITRIEPGGLTPAVELRSASTNVVPIASAAGRYELGLGSWILAAGTALDLALLRTRYELERPDGRNVIAEPWLIRPGAFVVLAFAPDP